MPIDPPNKYFSIRPPKPNDKLWRVAVNGDGYYEAAVGKTELLACKALIRAMADGLQACARRERVVREAWQTLNKEL
jgi:hypothetical protein